MQGVTTQERSDHRVDRAFTAGKGETDVYGKAGQAVVVAVATPAATAAAAAPVVVVVSLSAVCLLLLLLLDF